MEHKFFEALFRVASEVQITIAVIFGMLLQFFLGNKKTARFAVMVIGSSVFVSLYFIPPLVAMLHITPDSPLVNTLYALSSLLSIEFMSIVVAILPRVMRKKVLKFLGVEDDVISK